MKRLGVLIPPSNTMMETELNHWAPPSVTMHYHRLYRDSVPQITRKSLMTMIERLEESASLLAMAQVDLMVFGCTSASILEGSGWDQKISQRIEAATGIPAIATGTAMVEALRSRGIQKVALATPYPDDVTQLEATFLENNGFSVVGLGCLGIIDSYGIPVTPLEKVYQRAMQVELIKRGLKAEHEHEIKVYYRGAEVGIYSADLFVEDVVIVELKIAKTYNNQDEPQLLNELKATGIKVGLLVNFGRDEVQYKRMVF